MSERIKRQREDSQRTAKRTKVDACIGNLVNIRKYLGYFDTMHDFLDSSRLEKYFGNKKDAEKLIDKIESIFDLGFNCDIGNDEDGIIRKVFGTKSSSDIPYSEAIKQDLKVITNNTNLTPPFYGELFNERSINEKSIVVEYDQLPALVRWIDSLILDTNTKTYKQYILDYNMIPESAICDLIANDRIPEKTILKTIASEYDRNTTYKDTTCIQSKDYVTNTKSIEEKIKSLSVEEDKKYYLPFSDNVLTKENGELHEFESISIGSDEEGNFINWKIKDITGIIKIANLTSNDTARKKNLNLFIHGMIEIMKAPPSKKLPKARGKRMQAYKDMSSGYDLLISEIYELKARDFTNKNTYIRCLTDFKKIGDLLLVKIARLNDAVFISNDRVTCVMAALGYNVPTIRTSLIKQEKQDRQVEKEKEKRILTLYNFRNFITSEASKRNYLISSIKEYYNAITFYVNIPNNEYMNYKASLSQKLKEIKEKINTFEILTSDEMTETSVDDIIVSDSLSNPYTTVQEIIDSIVARFSKSNLQMYELLMVEHQLVEIQAILKFYGLNPESNQIRLLQKLHLQLREFNRAKQATRKDLIHLPPLMRRLIPFMDEIINESQVSRSRTRGTLQGFYNVSYARCLAYVPLLEHMMIALDFIEYITRVQSDIQRAMYKLYPRLSILDTLSYEELEELLRLFEAIFKENHFPLPGTLFNEKISTDKIPTSIEALKITVRELLEYNPISNRSFVLSQEIPLMNYPTHTIVHIMNKLNMSLLDKQFVVNFADYSYQLHVGVLDGSRDSLEELLKNIQDVSQFVENLKAKLYRSSRGGKGSPSFIPRTPGRSSRTSEKVNPMSTSQTPKAKEIIQQASMELNTPSKAKEITQQASMELRTPSIKEVRYTEQTLTNLDQLEELIDSLTSITIDPLQFVDMFDIFNTCITKDILSAETDDEQMDLTKLYFQVNFMKQVYEQHLPILKVVSRPMSVRSARSSSSRS